LIETDELDTSSLGWAVTGESGALGALHRQRFVQIAQLPDQEIDLAEAALLIAAEEYPELRPEIWLTHLDQLAEELAPRLAGARGDLDRVQRLTGFLFEELGLRGNDEDYYDPRNSFLNDVLERRMGIPISLSVLCIEVGRRVGIALNGVGFPGHFLVQLTRHPQILLDPFHGGRIVTLEDCAEILRHVTGGQIEFDPQLIQPIGPRQILLRMLRSLQGVYFQRGEIGKALPVIERILLLDPQDSKALRQRGLLHLRWCDFASAAQDLERYLEAEPEAEDRMETLTLLSQMQRQTTPIH
jgi:regulator of sirC expression with transglutaminase-like and TPR domain